MIRVFGMSYYSINEVATMLGMDRQTLKRYAEKGKISAFRHPLTQKIIFPKEEIDLLKVEFLKNNPPTSA